MVSRLHTVPKSNTLRGIEKETAPLPHLESKPDTQNDRTTEELLGNPIANRSDAMSPATPDTSSDTKGQLTDVISIPHEAKITGVSVEQPAATSVPDPLKREQP